MIEIKSEWKEFPNEDGKWFPVLIIYMGKNGEWFNTAIDATKFMENGELLLDSLKIAFTQLVRHLFPEITDPVTKYNKELESLNERVIYVKSLISEIESSRKIKEKRKK